MQTHACEAARQDIGEIVHQDWLNKHRISYTTFVTPTVKLRGVKSHDCQRK